MTHFLTLSFLKRELANNIRQNPFMMAAAIGTTALLIFLFGFFFLLFQNVRIMKNNLASQMKIHAYLNPGTSDRQALLLEHQIASLSAVQTVVYVNKEQAMTNLQKEIGRSINLSDLMNNPLSPYFAIQTKDLEDVGAVSSWLKSQPEVKNVHDLQDVVSRVVAFFRTADTFFFGSEILLFLGALFIISSLIRLGFSTRKKDVEMMHLFGASPGFIRLPFILEGTFYGFAGALLAILVLGPSYKNLAGQLAEIFPAFSLIPGKSMSGTFACLLGTGSLVGGLAGLLSVGGHPYS